MRFFKIIFFLLIGIAVSNSYADTTASVVPIGLIKDNKYDGSQTLHGLVPQEVSSSKLQYHAKATEALDLRIILPLRPGVDDLIKQLYDPTSPLFHHFLTPQQFTEEFGPSPLDSEPVKKFLLSQGLSIRTQSANGTVLTVTGAVSAVESAFKVHINHYMKSDGTPFFAPDADPIVPVQVAGKIIAISGMDNLHQAIPQFRQVPPKNKKSIASPQYGTGPNGGLSPADIYKAYNLNALPSNINGSGQTAALFEVDGYNPSDIASYDSQFHLPQVPLQNVYIDGFNGVPNYSAGGAEVTLDIEILTGMAPGLKKVIVYEAPNRGNGTIDEWQKIATDNLATIISASIIVAEEFSGTINSDAQVLQQMAAQGQAVFAASGDCGAYGSYTLSCGNKTILQVGDPSDQVYATGVGISNLTLNSDGTYNSESASTQSGGGTSFYLPIPSYQQGMITPSSLGSTSMRNVPDVSLTADPSTGYSFYINGAWGCFWGSSVATPIWAAFDALVNQGRAAANEAPLGFLNPALYQIAQSNNYSEDFHDITTGLNNGGVSGSKYYPAVAGYNDATGLGSFNGANLYKDLVAPTLPAPVQKPPTITTQPRNQNVSLGQALVGHSVSFSVAASGMPAPSYQWYESTNGNVVPINGATSAMNTIIVDGSSTTDTMFYCVVTNAAGSVRSNPVMLTIS